MLSSMKISVNNHPLDADPHRPIIEALRREGYHIPSMCYAEGYEYQPSCMVCMVKDVRTGQMIPSCSTLPYEGMELETDTEEVASMRREALELLLSDHRADCEAPCTIVCPRGIDVAQVILHYDRGDMAAAYTLLEGTSCDGCKAPCEKACRRRTVDESVPIRRIIEEVRNVSNGQTSEKSLHSDDENVSQASPIAHGPLFSSRLGRFTDREKEMLKKLYTQSSHCLHCACEGRSECRLRELATEAGIRSPRYGVQSSLPVKECVRVTERLYFEPAKCIRCGLCVYNTSDGFTFAHRGFDVRVVVPEESKKNVHDDVARLCPTGALHLRILSVLLPLLMLLWGCQGPSRRMSGTPGEDVARQEWTSFRGDVSLSGYATCRLPDSPTLLWEHRHGVRTVASPIVSKGIVWLCDKHGHLVGLNAEGTPTHSFNLNADVEASFVMVDSVLYVGQIDGLIRALVLPECTELWHYATEGQILASPTFVDAHMGEGTSDTFLLVGSYDNNMYTLDARTGTLAHSYPTGYYINGAAACWQGAYALFGGCDAWLRISDIRSGLLTDSLRLDAYIPSSPVVSGDCAYVADYQGNVYEIQLADDGHISEHRKICDAGDSEGGMISMPTVTADAVYLLADGRYLACLDRTDGHVRWRQMLRGDVGESSPLAVGDRVLVCTKTGIVSIYDAASGRLLWEYETGEQIVSSPAVVASRFYILTARGTLLCFG